MRARRPIRAAWAIGSGGSSTAIAEWALGKLMSQAAEAFRPGTQFVSTRRLEGAKAPSEGGASTSTVAEAVGEAAGQSIEEAIEKLQEEADEKAAELGEASAPSASKYEGLPAAAADGESVPAEANADKLEGAGSSCDAAGMPDPRKDLLEEIDVLDAYANDVIVKGFLKLIPSSQGKIYFERTRGSTRPTAEK